MCRIAVEPGLVACVKLVGDAVQGVAAQEAELLVVIVPCDLEAVSVDEESDGVALLWVEQVVADDSDTEQGVNFILVDAQV